MWKMCGILLPDASYPQEENNCPQKDFQRFFFILLFYLNKISFQPKALL